MPADTVRRLADTMFARYDTNGDSVLSDVERASIRTLDDSADKDGDGLVSKPEFTDWIATKYGRPSSTRRSFGERP